MADTPESVQVTEARARWRADLLRLHAGELQRLAGDDASAAASGLKSDADRKAAEADLHDLEASLTRELAEAKAASHADPSNERLHKQYTQVAEEMADARSTWRGIGEASGTRRGVATLDNFEEPSDADVLASHGGN